MKSTGKAGALDLIAEAGRELRDQAQADPLEERALMDPSRLDQDPALHPTVRSNLVRLANAYQRGGKEGLAKKFDEIHPPEATLTSEPSSPSPSETPKTKPK